MRFITARGFSKWEYLVDFGETFLGTFTEVGCDGGGIGAGFREKLANGSYLVG